MNDEKREDSTDTIDVPAHEVIFTLRVNKITKQVALAKIGSMDPLEIGKVFLGIAAQAFSAVQPAEGTEPKPRIIVPRTH